MKKNRLSLALVALLLTAGLTYASQAATKPMPVDQCVDVAGTSGPLKNRPPNCFGSGDPCCFIPGTSDPYRFN